MREEIAEDIAMNLAKMDREIEETIDSRRKRIPLQFEAGDKAIMKSNRIQPLDFKAEGPLLVLGYRDSKKRSVDYLNLRTAQIGRASVTNLKLLNT